MSGDVQEVSSPAVDLGSMRSKVKAKGKVRSRSKGAIKRLPGRSKRKGVDVSDLVGTIKLTVDPLDFQRSIRDEWE